MSFIDDIQGKNTQLYPIVEIDGQFYSTNNVTIGDNYCKPILMNIPSIKESIDIESRKFKISNVSLEFNNFPFDGVRFSDQLTESSLINTETTIYFKSQSTNAVEDMHEVYKGIIRRISHDDEKVKVELEDLTEQKAHKDLPSQEFLGDDSVLDKYKNKPIPMVYGHVEASPLLLTNTLNPEDYIEDILGDTIEKYVDIICDYRAIGGFVTVNPKYQHNLEVGSLYIYDNASQTYLNACLESKTNSQPETTQYIEDPDNAKITLFLKTNGGEGQNFPAQGMIECEDIKNTNSIQGIWTEGAGQYHHKTRDGVNALTNDSSYSQWQDILSASDENAPNFHFMGAYHSAGTSVTWNPSEYDNLSDYGRKLFILIRATFKNHNILTFAIDHPSLSFDGTYQSAELRIGTKEKVFTSGVDEDGLPVTHESGGDSLTLTTIGTGQTYYLDTINSSIYNNGLNYEGNVGEIGISWVMPSGTLGTNYGFIESKIEYLNAIERFVLKGFAGFDFYADVKGRTNTFNDHPSYLVSNNIPVGYWVENPIDIIYDLVRSELGHDAIDEEEYAEAKAAHDGWKFGFTVNKKINSKKLIEDIAKSTKCFPKFKNDGTFGFNTIKDSYDVANDYEDATQIKESEVISYSFKKTKPEQIYKKVTVSYNKDYAQDSYLKTVNRGNVYDTTGIGADPHYGIEKSEDAHLEFESDYIRHNADDGATADKLAEFLYEQYRNDHLTFNLRLPLKYIDLEIGDLVKFRELFQGVKAYGIDYRTITLQGYGANLDYQWLYPLFIITSTTKNLDSVSIECMQLHHLVPSLHGTDASYAASVLSYKWFNGLPYDNGVVGGASYYGEGVNGTFYFSDSEPLVIPEDLATEIVITPPNIIIDAPITTDIDTEEFTYDLHTHQATVIDGDQAGTDITDLLVVESMGQTFTGGQSHFVGEVDTDTNQIAVTYSITSPTTGLQSIQIFNYNINIRERQLPTVTVTPMAGADLGGDVWYSEILAEAGIQFEHYIKLADNMDANYWEKYVYNTSEFQEIQYSAVDNDNGEDLTNSVVLVAAGMINQLLLEGQGHQPYQHDPISIALSSWQSGNYLHLLEEGVPRYLTSTVMAFVWSDYGLYEYVKWHVRIELPQVEYGNFDLIPSGDINLDGVVDILDVVRVVNYILADQEGSAPALFEEQLHQADITQDGAINVLDIVTLVNVIMEN